MSSVLRDASACSSIGIIGYGKGRNYCPLSEQSHIDGTHYQCVTRSIAFKTAVLRPVPACKCIIGFRQRPGAKHRDGRSRQITIIIIGSGPAAAIGIIRDGKSRGPLCEQGVVGRGHFKRRAHREVGPVSGNDRVPSGKGVSGSRQQRGIAEDRDGHSCQIIIVVLGGGPGDGAVAIIGDGIGRVCRPLRE